jgi:hypothetical protein
LFAGFEIAVMPTVVGCKLKRRAVANLIIEDILAIDLEETA